MEIRLEEITESDLAIIKSIYDWYILNSTATFHTEPISLPELREFLYLDHPRFKTYLIYHSADVAGYCFLTHYKKRQAYDRTAEITLYLKPEYCGKGIGVIALNHLEQRAKQVQFKSLLAIISGDNTGSIRLFQKCGYEKCAHFKNVGEKFGRVLDVVAYQKEV